MHPWIGTASTKYTTRKTWTPNAKYYYKPEEFRMHQVHEETRFSLSSTTRFIKYHYGRRPRTCQVPLRAINTASAKFHHDRRTTAVDMHFAKYHYLRREPLLPLRHEYNYYHYECDENVYFPYTASNLVRSDNTRFEGITPRRRP